MPPMTPILLLEINEIPWRLIDRFGDQSAFSNISRGKMRGEPLNQSRSRVNADRIKDWMLAVSRDGCRAIPSLASACL